MPKPVLMPVLVAPMVRRIAALETRLRCRIVEGPAVAIRADADQLEQVLINLIRNAVDASLESNPAPADDLVEIGWAIEPGSKHGASQFALWVADHGPGVSNTANLFVPFFTTKPGGSGIGLVLSRQIVEAHGGMLHLASRPNGSGAEARITLPV
jgi:signal transduction histidine kinase